MNLQPRTFGFSDAFGDEWILTDINVSADNTYVKIDGGSLININECGSYKIDVKTKYFIDGKLEIIGYIYDEINQNKYGIWFFPQ